MKFCFLVKVKGRMVIEFVVAVEQLLLKYAAAVVLHDIAVKSVILGNLSNLWSFAH